MSTKLKYNLAIVGGGRQGMSILEALVPPRKEDKEGPVMMPQQKITRPEMRDVLGFQVPVESYYLHRGHAGVTLEGEDRVRVGLDDFSQKLLGLPENVRLPEAGQ